MKCKQYGLVPGENVKMLILSDKNKVNFFFVNFVYFAINNECTHYVIFLAESRAEVASLMLLCRFHNIPYRMKAFYRSLPSICAFASLIIQSFQFTDYNQFILSLLLYFIYHLFVDFTKRHRDRTHMLLVIAKIRTFP